MHVQNQQQLHKTNVETSQMRQRQRKQVKKQDKQAEQQQSRVHVNEMTHEFVN